MSLSVDLHIGAYVVEGTSLRSTWCELIGEGGYAEASSSVLASDS